MRCWIGAPVLLGPVGAADLSVLPGKCNRNPGDQFSGVQGSLADRELKLWSKKKKKSGRNFGISASILAILIGRLLRFPRPL